VVENGLLNSTIVASHSCMDFLSGLPINSLMKNQIPSEKHVYIPEIVPRPRNVERAFRRALVLASYHPTALPYMSEQRVAEMDKKRRYSRACPEKRDSRSNSGSKQKL
jgi:hypothetical protein